MGMVRPAKHVAQGLEECLHQHALAVTAPPVDVQAELKVGLERQAVADELLHEADQLDLVRVLLNGKELLKEVDGWLQVDAGVILHGADLGHEMIRCGGPQQLALPEVDDTIGTAEQMLLLLLGEVQEDVLLEHLLDVQLQEEQCTSFCQSKK